MHLKSIAFDAYGTLFDVYSVSSLAEELFPGNGAQLATIWRDKQIEYTRLRTLCDKYADFWQVTGDALDYACAILGIEPTPSSRGRLMGQYAELSAFPENAAQLRRLKDAGITLSILSNGTPWMLDQAVKASGLEGYFENTVRFVELLGHLWSNLVRLPHHLAKSIRASIGTPWRRTAPNWDFIRRCC
jgi:2-haloacid dehalogenase